MDITTARKLVELTKGDRKVLLTVYDGNQVSSCVEEAGRAACENCQADDAMCQEYVEHMKAQGYEVTEIELGELDIAESLPKFLRERAMQPPAMKELDEVDDAISGTDESLPGGAEASPEG